MRRLLRKPQRCIVPLARNRTIPVATEPRLTQGDEIAGYTPREPDRARRDGRGVPRGRRASGPCRRAEGARARARARRGLARAHPARVAAGGEPRPPERDPGLRGRRGGRARLHRDAPRRGQRPALAAPPRRPPRAGARDRPGRAGRLGARRRARARARPPRRQAEQRPDRRRSRSGSTATSPTSASRRASSDAQPATSRSGCSARSPTSPPSRSAATRSTRRADVYSLGCLLFECLTGEVAVRPRLRHRRRLRPPRGAAATPSERVRRAAARDRRGDRPGACQAAGRPLRDLRRARRRRPPRARAGRAAPPAARGSPLALAVAALAVVAAAIAVAAALRLEPAAAPAGSVVRIDPASGSVTARYRLSAHPAGVAVGPQVWVADFRAGHALAHRPRTGAAEQHSRDRQSARPRDPRRDARTSPATARRLLGGNVTRYDALTGGRIDGVERRALQRRRRRRRRLHRRLSRRRPHEHG